MLMRRFRARGAVCAPSGWAITPRTRARRAAASLTNSTDRRLRTIVSAWNKSQASRPSAGLLRQALLEVSTFRGAGRPLPARRLRRTVAALL